MRKEEKYREREKMRGNQRKNRGEKREGKCKKSEVIHMFPLTLILLREREREYLQK